MGKNELDSFLGRGSEEDNDRAGNDNLVLNLDDISEDAPDFKPLPAGVYNAIVNNLEFGYSKNENPMFTWQLRVTDHEYDGRLLFSHMVLNKDAGVKRIKRTLIRLGVETDFSKFNPAKFADEGDAIGLPCRVKLRIRPYDGRRVNDVTDILAPAEDTGAFLPKE